MYSMKLIDLLWKKCDKRVDIDREGRWLFSITGITSEKDIDNYKNIH